MFPRFRAPETMTADEQVRLLQETAAHGDPRDHVLYSMALGTGLRLRELLGLNVGDVSPDGKQVRRRIVLSVTKGSQRGEVFLPHQPHWQQREPPHLSASLLLDGTQVAVEPIECFADQLVSGG